MLTDSYSIKILRTGFLRRTTSVRVNSRGEIVVRAPSWVSAREIENFIKLKSNWINKQLLTLSVKQKTPPKRYINGEPHLFFGQELPLQITKLPYIKHCRLKLTPSFIQAIVPEDQPIAGQKKELQELMLKLYLEHGKKIINEKVYHYAQKLGVTYNRIVLKRVSSIWGSCSRLNNLNFNRKLIMAPHAIVDYVVIHEVCHLIHHHHRRDFWDLVKTLCPDYKTHIRWLKNNHHLLSL